MKIISIVGAAAILAAATPIGPASADPVVNAFYARCVAENAYQMQPAELDKACACMAPVLVSFLTDEAYWQIEAAIKNRQSISLKGDPYKGDPAELSRAAIKQCPAVGEAMYKQKCTGANEAAPQCQEMRKMIDAAH